MGSVLDDLPRDYAATNHLQALVDSARVRAPQCLDASVLALKSLLESDEQLNVLSMSMFAEATELVRAKRAHPAYLAIDNIQILMQLFDYIMTCTPEWEEHGNRDNLGGLPFNLVLMVLMETHSGLELFRHPTVNQHLERILHKWAAFLESPGSTYALNPRDGWLSRNALLKLEDVANKATADHRRFVDIYDCPDPNNANTLGFSSWDSFFCRQFKPGVRPIPTSEDLLSANKSIILNACESKPWRITRNCSSDSPIVLKGQTYSIQSMLGNDPLAETFVNGTVYQAYLSAMSYHRWHSPISGTIRKVLYLKGTYFSQLPMSDILAMEKSQAYLATVATRAVVFIDCQDSRIGTVCLVAVGMGEVSSCEVRAGIGDFVQAGDEIGTFHYGGSTHCLLFQRGLDVHFESHVETGNVTHNIPVRGVLAHCNWN